MLLKVPDVVALNILKDAVKNVQVHQPFVALSQFRPFNDGTYLHDAFDESLSNLLGVPVVGACEICQFFNDARFARCHLCESSLEFSHRIYLHICLVGHLRGFNTVHIGWAVGHSSSRLHVEVLILLSHHGGLWLCFVLLILIIINQF